MLPEPDAHAAAALADDLAAAGYASAAVRAAWGDDADDAIARGLHRPALRALDGRRDPLAVLARLFVLRVPQPEADVAAAVPTAGLEGLARLGLVADAAATGDATGAGGRSIRPLVLIRPQSFADAGGEAEWWIASDLDEAAVGGRCRSSTCSAWVERRARSRGSSSRRRPGLCSTWGRDAASRRCGPPSR